MRSYSWQYKWALATAIEKLSRITNVISLQQYKVSFNYNIKVTRAKKNLHAIPEFLIDNIFDALTKVHDSFIQSANLKSQILKVLLFNNNTLRKF